MYPPRFPPPQSQTSKIHTKAAFLSLLPLFSTTLCTTREIMHNLTGPTRVGRTLLKNRVSSFHMVHRLVLTRKSKPNLAMTMGTEITNMPASKQLKRRTFYEISEITSPVALFSLHTFLTCNSTVQLNVAPYTSSA